MDVNSREYIFAIEIMASVMEQYCIKWKPNKSHFHKNQSPFTPVVKKAVQYIWKEKEEFIQDLFDTVMHMGTINMENYKSAIEFASHLVIEAEYDEIELLRFCVIASGYASIFFLSGLEHVPGQCIKLIYNTIMSFRAKNQFTDESWHDIEILGGAYSVQSLCNEDLSKSTSAYFSQACEISPSDNFLQIDAYTEKLKTNTVNKYQKIVTKMSEACNTIEKEIPHIRNNVETVGISKDNDIISQIENTSENINMIVCNTKKANIIKQINENSKSDNASEVTDITKSHTKIKHTKIFGKNYKNKKHKLSKNKKFKANKNTRNAYVYKGIPETNYKTKKTKEKESLSNVYLETSETNIEPERTKNLVEDALLIKNTDTNKKVKGVKRKKTKCSKYKTKSNIVETDNFESPIKQLPKNVIENYNVLSDALVIKNTDNTDIKVKGIKRKKPKYCKLKTECGIVTTENFASAITQQQLSKTFIDNNTVLLNSEKIINAKKLKYNKKLSKITYVAENVECRVPISEIKITTNDVKRNKHDKFRMAKDDFENMSEIKDGFKDLSTDGDIAESNKTAHKIHKKIKLSKYKTRKLKDKSFINKEKNRKQIKEDERNIDSLEDSVISNASSQYLFEEEFEIEGKLKKRKVIKNKSNKLKTKEKFKNENSLKNVPLSLCTSDEYASVETVEDNVNVVCKNPIGKKRKYDHKLIKNITINDRKKSDKFKRITRQSTREQNANCLEIDIEEEKRKVASTSGELQPASKNSNTRSPGCEISNLVNGLESEKSETILQKFFENFRSKMRKSKTSENKDPKT